MNNRQFSLKEKVVHLKYKAGICAIASLISLFFSIICVFVGLNGLAVVNFFIAMFNYFVSNKCTVEANELSKKVTMTSVKDLYNKKKY